MVENLQKTIMMRNRVLDKLASKSRAHTRVVQPRLAYKYAPPREGSTGELIALNATSSYANLNRSSSQAASLCLPTDDRLGSMNAPRAAQRSLSSAYDPVSKQIPVNKFVKPGHQQSLKSPSSSKVTGASSTFRRKGSVPPITIPRL